MQLRSEIHNGFLNCRVVRDHLLSEIVDLLILRLRQGEFAVIDIDRIRGEDDSQQSAGRWAAPGPVPVLAEGRPARATRQPG